MMSLEHQESIKENSKKANQQHPLHEAYGQDVDTFSDDLSIVSA